MDIRQIFEKCRSDIGGENNNKDIRWYLKERPKRVSRKSFFEQVVWAIWVSGMRRKSVDKFLERAGKNGFSWDFNKIGLWNKNSLHYFMKNLHGSPVPERARKKWEAVHDISKMINNYADERDFQKSFFGGKAKSVNLDKGDVQRLVNLRLPFIGKRNAQFIVRNMGGEAIKCDRWIEEFLRHHKISLNELEIKVKDLRIPLGLFDIVLWAYCEKAVGTVKKFNKHFKQHFA